MNECQFYNQKKWIDYLRNQLNRDELEAAQFHLLHCTDCRKELERIRALARCMDVGVSTEKKAYFWQRASFKVAATVAVLIALSAGGYFYLYMSPSGEEYPIQITVPPAYHAVDSVQIDSTKIKPDSVVVAEREPR